DGAVGLRRTLEPRTWHGVMAVRRPRPRRARQSGARGEPGRAREAQPYAAAHVATGHAATDRVGGVATPGHEQHCSLAQRERRARFAEHAVPAPPAREPGAEGRVEGERPATGLGGRDETAARRLAPERAARRRRQTPTGA